MKPNFNIYHTFALALRSSMTFSGSFIPLFLMLETTCSHQPK